MAQDRDIDRRPDPDALLALVGKETRGRLWVFLGAAPRVGKTYAMLARARRRMGSTSSSASSRRTGAPRPPRCSKGSRSCRAA